MSEEAGDSGFKVPTLPGMTPSTVKVTQEQEVKQQDDPAQNTKTENASPNPESNPAPSFKLPASLPSKPKADSNPQKEAPSPDKAKNAVPGVTPKAPPLPYKRPKWSGHVPPKGYALEVLKNGAIVERVKLEEEPFYVVGRLPKCDLALEHPSLSRYHAVVQYRGKGKGQTEDEKEEDDEEVGEKGFYLYDLGSTHGTWHNKKR